MRRAHPSRAGAIALALTIGLLLAPGAKTSSAPDRTTATMEAANRQAAEEDVVRTLAIFRAPPGAREEPSFPSDVQELLGASGSEPYSSRLVKRHADWLAPGKPQEVLRWLERHQAPGWNGGMTIRYGGPEGRSWSAYLEWRREVEGIWSKSLLITTVGLPGRQTAVRAEAQDTWLLPRSPADRVPPAARLLTVSVGRGDATRSISTSNPAVVRRVAKLINAQRLVQGEFFSCGMEGVPAAPPKLVRLEFRAGRGGRLLAAASKEVPGGLCKPLQLRVPGRKAVSLEAGQRVIHNVRGLLERLRG